MAAENRPYFIATFGDLIAVFGATILLLILSRILSWEPFRYLGLACGLATMWLARSHRKTQRNPHPD